MKISLTQTGGIAGGITYLGPVDTKADVESGMLEALVMATDSSHCLGTSAPKWPPTTGCGLSRLKTARRPTKFNSVNLPRKCPMPSRTCSAQLRRLAVTMGLTGARPAVDPVQPLFGRVRSVPSAR